MVAIILLRLRWCSFESGNCSLSLSLSFSHFFLFFCLSVFLSPPLFLFFFMFSLFIFVSLSRSLSFLNSTIFLIYFNSFRRKPEVDGRDFAQEGFGPTGNDVTSLDATRRIGLDDDKRSPSSEERNGQRNPLRHAR